MLVSNLFDSIINMITMIKIESSPIIKHDHNHHHQPSPPPSSKMIIIIITIIKIIITVTLIISVSDDFPRKEAPPSFAPLSSNQGPFQGNFNFFILMMMILLYCIQGLAFLLNSNVENGLSMSFESLDLCHDLSKCGQDV